MDLKKIISLFVLFSLILVVPSAVAAIKTFHVQETDLVKIAPEALDPDHDQVTYTYSLPLDKNGQWQTGYDDAGEYLLKITASDGLNQTTKEVLLIVDNKNQPPYGMEKKVQVKELQSLDLKQLVADPDGDALEYVFTKPFDRKGIWTPGFDDQGTYIAKFSARDGEFTVPMRLEVEVLNTNQPPAISKSFSNENTISLSENESLSYYADAADGDNDSLSYSWTLNGVEISKEARSSHFFDFESSGSYKLAVAVSDGKHRVEKKWALKVENVNRKPVTDFAPITVKEGEKITLSLPQKDLDGDILTYKFDAEFDQAGVWQTTYDDAGEYTISFQVSDGKDKVKGKLKVTILNVDRAPRLNLPVKLEVREGENLSFKVDSSDPDGDKVNVTFLATPPGAVFDSKSNVFTWSPGYDYIRRTEGLLSNILNSLRLEKYLLKEREQSLQVRACSKLLCSTGTVFATGDNSNRAPILQVPSKMNITEGETLQLEPSSTDPDGDIVRYYFTEPLQKKDGYWKTSYSDAGKYTIYVTATDGSSSQTLPVAVTVLGQNRQPTIIVPHDRYLLSEGQEFTIPVQGTDPDNDSLSLTVENLPSGASFRNHTLFWKPGYETVKPNGSGSSGNSLLSELSSLSKDSGAQQEIWISFVAADKEFKVYHPVKLTVKNINQLPEIISFTPNATTIAQDQPLLFSVKAQDRDNDKLTYSWRFTPGDDVITGTDKVERTFTSAGEKRVSLVVSDGTSEVEHHWDMTVPEENLAPALNNSVALEEPKFKVYVIDH